MSSSILANYNLYFSTSALIKKDTPNESSKPLTTDAEMGISRKYFKKAPAKMIKQIVKYISNTTLLVVVLGTVLIISFLLLGVISNLVKYEYIGERSKCQAEI